MIDDTLFWLLVLTSVLSVLLVLASTAAFGRKLADLEYQDAAGINGVRRIQAWINLRTHGNRVFLGLTFMVVSVLTLADAPLLWRTWVGRVLFIAVLANYTISSVLDWFAEREQVRLLLDEQRRLDARGVSP